MHKNIIKILDPGFGKFRNYFHVQTREHDRKIASQQSLEAKNLYALGCMIHKEGGGETCTRADMLQNVTSGSDVKMMYKRLPRSEHLMSAEEFLGSQL